MNGYGTGVKKSHDMSECSERSVPVGAAGERPVVPAVSADEEKIASGIYERFEPTFVHTMALHHFHRYFFAERYCVGKRVLDIACGSGYGADIVSRSAESVLGVDIDGETIRKCRETYRSGRLRFVQGSVEKIPAEDAAFDVVLSFETIEHVDAGLQRQFLREIRRVLRPGGMLIISSPGRNDWTGNEFHVHELTEEEFLELLQANFRNCRHWKQKVVLGSFIKNAVAAGTSATLFGIRAEDGKPIVPWPPDVESKYSIALCSDGEVPECGDSVNLDVSGRIMDAMIRQFVLRSVNPLRTEFARARDAADKRERELKKQNSELSSEFARYHEGAVKRQREVESEFARYREGAVKRQRAAEKEISDLERTRREERRLLRIQLAERGGTWQWRDLPRLAVRALRHPVGTFRLWREMRLIRRSGLFSEHYYRLKNPEIAANFHGSMLLHFCLFGWREGRDPSVLFSVSEYSRRHPGPEGRETNPLIRRIRAEIRENAEDHDR